jgi:hypothetical protein
MIFFVYKRKEFLLFYYKKIILLITCLINNNRVNWKNSSCSCKSFFKNYICHHIVGLAYRYKLIVIPENAKTVPISKKRPRGRPAKRKPALFYQPDIPQPTQLINDQLENENEVETDGDEEKENQENIPEERLDVNAIRAEDVDIQKPQNKQKLVQSTQAIQPQAEIEKDDENPQASQKREDMLVKKNLFKILKQSNHRLN